MAKVQISCEDGDLEPIKNFPIDSFPSKIVEVIHAYVRSLNLNVDYASASFLVAFAGSIGSQYSIQVKRGWVEFASIFLALVGRPGINKSGPLSIFTRPLEKIDFELFDAYKKQIKLYKTMLKNEDSIGLEAPVRQQLVIKDSTQEALLLALYNNPHGLIGIHDELSSFLNSFNKYRSSGGDEELYLSIFSGKPYSNNRKNSEPILIERPVLSIIGGIQPMVLSRLFNSTRNENGFTHRFLFVQPENLKRGELSDSDLSADVEISYEKFIRLAVGNLQQFNQSLPAPRVFLFSDDAMEVYKELRRSINDIINGNPPDSVCGIYAKLEIYFIRFSLILHVMENLSAGSIPSSRISAETTKRALKLYDYFRHMALKVSGQIDAENDPLMNYPLRFREVLSRLPAEFSTDEAWAFFSTATKNRKTMFNYLKQIHLFTRIEVGRYQRKY